MGKFEIIQNTKDGFVIKRIHFTEFSILNFLAVNYDIKYKNK